MRASRRRSAAFHERIGAPSELALLAASVLTIAGCVSAAGMSEPVPQSARDAALAARLRDAELSSGKIRTTDRVPVVDPVLRWCGVRRPPDTIVDLRDADGVWFSVPAQAWSAVQTAELDAQIARVRTRLPPGPSEHPLFGAKLGRVAAGLSELPPASNATEATEQLRGVLRVLRAEFGRTPPPAEPAADHGAPAAPGDAPRASDAGTRGDAGTSVFGRYHKRPDGGALTSLADGNHIVEFGTDGSISIRNLLSDEVELRRAGARAE